MATCETNGHLWGIDHRCIFCKTINLEPIPQSMQERELTAYQIAKDNLELRLSEYEMDCLADVTNIPAQVY